MPPELPNGSGVSDQDAFALINALQVNPRAAWSSVGRALRIDPSTAARRWQRLEAAGEAWVAAYPLRTPTRMLAFVELRCRSGQTVELASRIARDPQCMNLDITTGERDLFLTLVTRSAGELAEYVLRRFDGLDGVLGVTTRLEFKQYTDGSNWRTRTPSRHDTLTLAPDRPARPVTSPTVADWDLASALGRDGRLSVAELAGITARSEASVRRRLNQLLGSGQLRLRCDIARSRSQTPVGAWIFLRVPPDGVDHLGAAIAQHPLIRFAGLVDGPSNLAVQAWVADQAELPALEAQLVRMGKNVELVDRCVVLHSVKRVGRILDTHGRAVRIASTDLREPPAWASESVPLDDRIRAAPAADTLTDSGSEPEPPG